MHNQTTIQELTIRHMVYASTGPPGHALNFTYSIDNNSIILFINGDKMINRKGIGGFLVI